MLNKRYQAKLEEEIGLISDSYYEIGTEEEPAYYFNMSDGEEKVILQMKESTTGIIFTYGLIIKKLVVESAEDILKKLTENWEYKQVYLWPMEINEEWYLIASKKSFFETYLPGQIKNQLDIVKNELAEKKLK